MSALVSPVQVEKQRCWSWTACLAPCQDSCPLNLDISGSVTAIARGEFAEAVAIEKAGILMPGICGWVCHHPCESACIRAKIDEPLAIQSLKRFIADYELNMGLAKPTPGTRTEVENVAIVGSGPAGLIAAYDLVRQGYGVTIFEAQSVIGGMLAFGIPEFVLPRRVLQNGISYMDALGIEFRNNTALGRDLSLDDIFQLGYKAIFLALGTQKSLPLDLPGMSLAGIFYALPLLEDVNSGRKVETGSKVVVVGGGNVAMDAARTAVRLGAAEVQIACLESREEMPASSWEVTKAEEEGVRIHPSLAPQKILGGEGRVVGITFAQVSSIEFDARGNIKPVIVAGSEQVLNTDTVIVAIGQCPDMSFLSGAPGLNVDQRGAIIADADTLATNLPGVFSGGDVVSARGTVTEAMAAGRKAALSINRYLRKPELGQRFIRETMTISEDQIPRFVERRNRHESPKLPIAERIHSFKEVDLSFSDEMAISEAKRCLNCPMCGNCIFYRSQMCYEVATRLL